MSWTVSYLVLSVLCLSPGSVIKASGQGQMTDAIRTIKGGDIGQCPSMEERERARNELSQAIYSLIVAHTTMPTLPVTYTCNGTPGWKRVAFVNMTDTSYNCPTGLS